MVDILLVEPDRVLGKTYARALTGAGFKVAVCPSAQAAIQQVDKQRPSLVILELQLSEHNGVEFLYELRSYSDWQKKPIIILTTITPAEAGLSQAVQKKLGIAAYCYKPQTSLEQLIEHVNAVIK